MHEDVSKQCFNECSRDNYVLDRNSILGKNASEDFVELPAVPSPQFSVFSLLSEAEHYITFVEIPGLVDQSGEVPGKGGHGGIKQVYYNN